mmetsp:Transcript_36774/g.63487  ORF Transcript_36774/g.63487 Transcript_36774/m.63487 type:complete len:93 (-) Transcript_36774:177-455(-)
MATTRLLYMPMNNAHILLINVSVTECFAEAVGSFRSFSKDYHTGTRAINPVNKAKVGFTNLIVFLGNKGFRPIQQAFVIGFICLSEYCWRFC